MPGTALEKPRTDDRLLWDVLFGIYGFPAALLAHKFKLFSLLEKGPRTLPEIGAELGLKRRPTAALLSTTVSLGFLRLQDGRYGLTPVAEDYLLESSPTYFGTSWDWFSEHYSVCSLESLERAMRTDTAQAYGGQEEIFKSHEEQAELARSFTRTMHSISMAPASAWPEVVDLSERKVMLDIGGGSGAHSIGAALKYPHLRAIIFDREPVCEVATEFVTQYGLAERIGTHVGDMWEDTFPPADVHLYSSIFHDWTPEKCALLTRKSFESLTPGGEILIHEMLYDDDKAGPFPIAAFSMIMLGWTEGEQYSERELSDMLRDAGFTDLKRRSSMGYWSVVSGRKAG